MRITIIALCFAALLQCPAQTVLVESTFDADAEGWTVLNGNIRHDTNGFVWVRVPNEGDTSFYIAPQSFLGNKSGAYGGSLQFSMRDNRQGNYGNTTVILASHDRILRRNTAYPTAQWQDYDIPLTTNLWRTDAAMDSPPPTEAEMIAVLSDLTGLRIRAEYSNSASNETNALDNVRIIAPLCVTNTVLRVYREPDALRLEWPTNACGFWIYSATNIPTTNWIPVPTDDIIPLTITNGFMNFSITPDSRPRFFQLQHHPVSP